MGGACGSLFGACWGEAGGDGSWRRGRGGLWSLSPTGLPGRTGTLRTRKTGQYMLNEFGARGRQGSVRRWGRLLGWGWLWPGRKLGMGRGWAEAVARPGQIGGLGLAGRVGVMRT